MVYPVQSTIVLGSRETYSASIDNLSPAATATDMVTITGSATRRIRVTRMVFWGSTTANNIHVALFLLRRSTANTGGTSSTITAVPSANTNSAATATVRSYTANPTLGTLVGNVSVAKKFLANTGSSLPDDPLVWDLTQDGVLQGLVLNGTGDVLALNFNGAALPNGFNVNVSINWIEE